ncbi:MAG: hypothetical protein COA70_09380 [Planctomycetota bacterium]|nr:MAG: hypothetical protein COA70_09380 [Planctomycetota bacterium]
MNHPTPHPIGNPEELASLYLAGSMTVEEVAQFEDHLDSGCAMCHQELLALDVAVEGLLQSSDSAQPAPALRDEVLQQAQNSLESVSTLAAADDDKLQPWQNLTPDASNAAGFFNLSNLEQGEWHPTGVEGVAYRKLFFDGEKKRLTAIFRMDPGASYPAHDHTQDEECLVLGGELIVDERLTMRRGDFQRAEAGSRHGLQRTETGCLLLITSGMADEMIPATA